MSAPPDHTVLARAADRWMADHPAMGTVACDLTGCVRAWNHWMERHSGRLAAEVVGKPLVEVFPDVAERKLTHYFDDAANGVVRVLSQRLHAYLLRLPTHVGGARFEHMQQSAQVAPIVHEGRIVGTIAAISDVTERCVREAELHDELVARTHLLAAERAARAEADAANRIKDEFLAVLSHELRTPLHAILGWTRALRDEAVTSEKLSRALDVIERNAQAQTNLIEDLLDVSRIASGNLRIEKRLVDPRRPIDNAVEILRPAFDAKKVRLTVNVPPELQPVVGDANRLQQIVWNLLGNAVKFTPAGGHVSLSADTRNGRLSLVVSDSGQGIAPDFLPHVFERFRQSDSSSTRAQGGLGLGLSIVAELAHLHDGTIAADSDGPGRGATFTVTIPIADVVAREGSPLADARDSLDLPEVEGALQGVRVLLVDDDDDGREVMGYALSYGGADVMLASSAEDAREVFASTPPDVLISDVGMPGEDGYALIQGLRATGGQRIPAIALTGYGGLENEGRARAAGFDAHLTKPVSRAVLIAEVARLANRRAV